MVSHSPRIPYKGKGIHITVDASEAYRVLNPAIYKTALAEGMMEAANLLMQETSRTAPVFHGERPQNPIGTPLEPEGSLSRSLSIRRVANQIFIISEHQGAKYIIEGHKALEKLGSRKWFFANYPYGYHDVKGNPVPPDDWTMSAEMGITFVTEVVTQRLRSAVIWSRG